GTPQDIEVSADGNTLYIANEAGWLDVRDITSGARTDSIPVPAAFALAVTPDGAQIWITQSALGSVTVVDRASRAIAQRIYTLGTPRHIAFAPGGSVALIANEQGFVQVIE
ncbi:MAG: YncE family protein, partial [Gemmatimonadales bacterium]